MTNFINNKEIEELSEGMEVAVPNYQNKSFDFRNSTSPSVVNTFTNDCSLKCGSFDQIGHLSIDNDKAKYSVSSGSEINELASSRNDSNFDFSTTSTCHFNFEINESTSLEDKEEINLILDRCSFNSSNKYSGANNFRFFENNKLFVTPLPVNPVNIIPESTINSTESIYFSPGYSFLYLSCIPLLTSLANRIASSSVNLDFETILLNSSKSSCSISRLMAPSLATSDQFTHGNLSIFAFNSPGTVNETFAIYASPLCLLNNSNSSSSLTLFSKELLNTSDQFISGCLSNLSLSSFGNDIVTVGISDHLRVLISSRNYVRILENVRIYKPFDYDYNDYAGNKEFKLELRSESNKFVGSSNKLWIFLPFLNFLNYFAAYNKVMLL